MDLLRWKAARRVAIATLITLTLVLPTAYSQTSPTSDKPAAPAATDGDINAFLSSLDKKAAAPAANPAVALQTPSVVATESSDEIRPTPLLVDDESPFRTLFLMIGGVIVCALATVGLTLTFFALRKDMNRRKRGHRRPSSSGSAVHAAHR